MPSKTLSKPPGMLVFDTVPDPWAEWDEWAAQVGRPRQVPIKVLEVFVSVVLVVLPDAYTKSRFDEAEIAAKIGL